MSYFKIKVDRLTEKIKDPIYPDISIELNESQLGMLQGLEKHRFWVHISARRTGKSYAASILALAKLLEPSQQVMVVAPNYNLSSIIWEYVIGFITRLGLKTVRRNNKDRIFQLENGSTFRLLSASNRDSLVGRAANLLIVDEAAVIDNDEYFTRDLRPVLSTFPDTRCLFITTPRGKANYIYEYYMRGNDPDFPDWGSDLFTCKSNSSALSIGTTGSPYSMNVVIISLRNCIIDYSINAFDIQTSSSNISSNQNINKLYRN